MVLWAGSRILITGGLYKGGQGTILKINHEHHMVHVDTMGQCFILHYFCVFFNDPNDLAAGQPDPIEEYTIGGTTTTQALLELFANSIINNKELLIEE
jgi:hypothetical protein